MSDTERFLTELWEGKPDELFIMLWTLKDHQSHWFTSISKAATAAKALENDVYVEVSLSTVDRGPGKRTHAVSSAGIPGLWADIDYQSGEAHKGIDLPPDEAAAWKVIEAIGLVPTLVVHSGHGLQPWWLFKEPLIFEVPQERDLAAEMSQRWQETIQAKAKKLGYRVDSVHDLARVMRVPGTYNCKTEPKVPVSKRALAGGRIADWDDFETVLINPTGFLPVACTSGVVASDASLKPQPDAIIKPVYTARDWSWWEETMAGVPEGERNTRMTSFAGKLVSLLGDLDDETTKKIALRCCLLVNLGNRPPMPENEVRKTFFQVLGAEVGKRASEQMFQENAEMIAAEGGDDQRITAIRDRIGGLPVAKIIKRGRADPEYIFVLTDGERINVGNLLNIQAVRKKILDCTKGKYLIPSIKQAQWFTLCKAMVSMSIYIEVPDLDRTVEIESLIQDWLKRTTIFPDDNWKEGAKSGGPFIRGSSLFLYVPAFQEFLRTGAPSEKIDKKSIYHAFSDIGYKRETVSYRDNVGNRTTSRWARALHDGEEEQLIAEGNNPLYSGGFLE